MNRDPAPQKKSGKTGKGVGEENDLLAALEKEVIDGLKKTDITAKERLDYIAKGTQLVLIRHKIKPTEDEEQFFK